MRVDHLKYTSDAETFELTGLEFYNVDPEKLSEILEAIKQDG